MFLAVVARLSLARAVAARSPLSSQRATRECPRRALTAHAIGITPNADGVGSACTWYVSWRDPSLSFLVTASAENQALTLRGFRVCSCVVMRVF